MISYTYVSINRKQLRKYFYAILKCKIYYNV